MDIEQESWTLRTVRRYLEQVPPPKFNFPQPPPNPTVWDVLLFVAVIVGSAALLTLVAGLLFGR